MLVAGTTLICSEPGWPAVTLKGVLGIVRLKSGMFTLTKTPGALDEALDCLERDHEFLLQGDVFTPDVISTWIWYKREKEVDAIRLRPHPYEFAMYYDI